MDSDRCKARSSAITEGPSRAPARAMFKAVGFSDEDLRKPIIGIANTWTEVGPCNYHLREIAVAVKEGVREAGGTPMEFNTIAVSDGITMGSEGMRASLVSREVIADSIELVARGHMFDGVVALSSCDKTIPGTVMALARLDVPSLMLYGGSIAPGHYQGHDVTIQDVFEAVGKYAQGKINDAELNELERRCLSRPRRMWRAVHGQHHVHGMRVPGHLADGQQRRSCHVSLEAGSGEEGRPTGHGASAPRYPSFAHHYRIRAAKCTYVRRRFGRFDQRGAALAGNCQRVGPGILPGRS